MSETPRHGPRPIVAKLSAYEVSRSAAPIDLKLDGNEGRAPSAELFAALSEAGPELLRRYPDAGRLEAMLAARCQVDARRVLVTAGGDDALDRICRSLLGAGRELILPVPTFEMFQRYALLAGAEVSSPPWPAGSPFPVAEVLSRVSAKTTIIGVISPNNPTGAVVTAEQLRSLSEGAPGVTIVADMAYLEFADEGVFHHAVALPNVVIVRTLSKAYGLAGLRVGYAVGSVELIGWLRVAGAPYSVASPSIALACAQLERDPGEARGYVERVKLERVQLQKKLRELGVRASESHANFVLGRFRDAPFVRDALAGLGIGVRLFPGRAELEGCLRVTCPGDLDDFARLLAGLEAVLTPEALLLDLDGVLADVSGSYRAAIIETARLYGVELSMDQVVAAKLRGGSNNDWRLTWALLEEAGVSASLTEVAERFEEIYQGSAEVPGLRARESLLVSPTQLSRLAANVPLAVVTGRPRADAERFLLEHGIAGDITVLACLEDGASKPAPDTVLVTLEALGVRRAWMLGDSVDDVRAARAAGVLPLAMVAPGDDAEASRDALLRAGAARVLASFEDLGGLLP